MYWIKIMFQDIMNTSMNMKIEVSIIETIENKF